MGRFVGTSGIIVSTGGVRVGAAGECCYMQSRLCSDGTLSGKWLKVSDIPATNALTEGGTCYWFDVANDLVFPCPGTLHTLPVSSIVGCGDPSCCPCPSTMGCCAGGCTPVQWHVTITGATTCTACQVITAGVSSYKAVGNINGTYILPQTAGCFWQLTTTNLQVYSYNSNDTCTGVPDAITDMIISIGFDCPIFNAITEVATFGGGWIAFPQTFQSAGVANPFIPYTMTNSAPACGSQPFTVTGGTAVFTPC